MSVKVIIAVYVYDVGIHKNPLVLQIDYFELYYSCLLLDLCVPMQSE